ncbi:DUF934 domain-containing protein, partial [Vibrio parahaemolyticus]|nr:DUF934 domain-containing protein [Vibrio parahaemolyticus]
MTFPNDADIEELEAGLPRLALVALHFPKWTDGRAYSQALLLRRRYRFAGDIRATGDVLMFALMNREALAKTAELGRALYYSRSRGKLWLKGKEAGHVQQLDDIRLDCDSDVVLLKVRQMGHEAGIACHTGRHSCF